MKPNKLFTSNGPDGVDPSQSTPRVVQKITEDFAASVAGLKEEVKSHHQSQAERLGKIEARVEELRVHQAAMPQTVMFEEFDINELRNSASMPDRGRASFNRMLISKPSGSDETRAMVYGLQKASDDFLIVSSIMQAQRAASGNPMSHEELKSLATYRKFAGMREMFKSALDSATAGEGVEWVPTGLSARIIEKVYLQWQVAALFQTFPMPTDPFDWPFETALPRARLIAQSTAFNTNPWADMTQAKSAYAASGPTGKVTLSTSKLRAFMPYTRELDETSIVALLPWLEGRIAFAIGSGWETAIQNGDTTATHMDNDIHTDGDTAILAERAIKGIRWHNVGVGGNAKTVAGGAAVPTTSKLRGVRALMGAFGRDANELTWVGSLVGMFHMMNLAEVITVDKYGPNATIIKGEMGKHDNIPFVVGPNWKDNLHTTGVNASGQSNNTTSLQLVNTKNAIWGTRPGLGVEQDRMKLIDQSYLVMFDQKSFKYLGAVADAWTAALINLPSTL